MTGRRSLALFTLLLLVASTVPATRLAAAPPAICLAAGDSLAAGIGSTLPRERSAAALLCRWSEAFFGDRA
ncbi:MAG: lipolytic protein G-D-S-L, partial [Thermomicrobium sp.]|nr:lipolytic protein G-D-S-L [Thermomicrobium sp.]